MGTRLYVGNLSYNVTEGELRDVFAEGGRNVVEVKIVMDRDTGRPRGFAFVEFLDRAHAEQAIQKFHGQPFNGRPLSVSEARAREDRGPGAPRPGGFSPRPPPAFGGPRTFDPAAAPGAPRSRNFGPDAKPQRGGSQKAKKKDDSKPRGPIPVKSGSRSYSLDDDSPDVPLTDFDDFATSKPEDKDKAEPEDDKDTDES